MAPKSPPRVPRPGAARERSGGDRGEGGRQGTRVPAGPVPGRPRPRRPVPAAAPPRAPPPRGGPSPSPPARRGAKLPARPGGKEAGKAKLRGTRKASAAGGGGAGGEPWPFPPPGPPARPPLPPARPHKVRASAALPRAAAEAARPAGSAALRTSRPREPLPSLSPSSPSLLSAARPPLRSPLPQPRRQVGDLRGKPRAPLELGAARGGAENCARGLRRASPGREGWRAG
ncbi:proline-rich protein 2-like [Phaenicophaeus curvirostris]|uniref:proline-rich protein 2-like n=1 Tax=Phaenicophaeus curvirostris TaxID=33595 RepID=UPI0037F09909